jgi:hypothetical protein
MRVSGEWSNYSQTRENQQRGSWVWGERKKKDRNNNDRRRQPVELEEKELSKSMEGGKREREGREGEFEVEAGMGF